ncbi:MAG: DNA repair protein RecO [Bacteroidetes bacterium]|nr:DNA repair protein RecO [Bacteroidota bacterium]MCL2303118.1 DNA repair protein RecO [Lentimicrobiaceae bacterium]
MLTTTQGIVLQTTKYSDNSLIVKIFTRKNGALSFIIKNAFSKKSKQPVSFFTPLTILELIYNETYTEKLTFLKEVNIAHPFHAIPMDIKKNSLLLFYQELLMKLLYHANAPDEELFDFIKEHLLKLENTPELTSDFHIVFLVQLIQKLGYAPELNFSLHTPYFSIEDSNFGNIFLEIPYYLSKEASFYLFTLLRAQSYAVPDKKIRIELLNGMILYLMKYHKQIKEIESVAILSEVLR